MSVLEVDGVLVQFGGVIAVDHVSLEVRERELLALIGPNGAGKTTLFNAITGIVPAREGRITFKQDPITHLETWQRSLLGISRTFQHSALFEHLTVEETILMGLYPSTRTSFLGGILRTPAARREAAESRAKAREVARFVGLEPYLSDEAHGCPHSVQRRIDLARAIVREPALLLLDEPVAGMTAQEKEDFRELVRRLREQFALSIVLVEHDLNVVMGLADRIVVVDLGQKIADGPPQEVRSDPTVVAAYMGTSDIQADLARARKTRPREALEQG